jgi:hypothetical protein
MINNKSKTRRIAKRKNAMSIPEIKSAFENIEETTYRILREGGTLSDQVKKFQKEWKANFHRPVRADSAEAYLKIKQVSKKRPNKTRKQKGGAGALAGAPLDYATRPGVYGDGKYGSFLDYQTMGTAPTPPSIAMDADCGVKDISPSVASLVAAQTGGTLSDLLHGATLSPSVSATPPSQLNNMGAYLDGKPSSPSPAPYQSSGLQL